jgi:chemotaxis receptor (MCP) glutamine deamidase CheD
VTPGRDITLHVGDVRTAAAPTILQTVLGSCVAVCLWDPELGLGGMNHFLLPHGSSSGMPGDDPTRFGVHAMDRLVGEMLKRGAVPRRWVAKVFGGASVLALGTRTHDIPHANVAFVDAFLPREGYTVAARSVGGTAPMHVRFHTDTGRVRVRRLQDAREAAAVAARESRPPLPPEGEVTLF